MFGYIYKADTLCAAHAVAEVTRYNYANGTLPTKIAGRAALASFDLEHLSSQWQVDAVATATLDEIAAVLEVDSSDPRSFDSDDFPKWADFDGEPDVCAVCDRVIDTGEINPEPAAMARAEGMQTVLENVMREIGDEIEECATLGRAFDVAPTWEAFSLSATRILSAYLEASREGLSCPDEISAHVSYVGMEF
jgi:hypothetical protein